MFYIVTLKLTIFTRLTKPSIMFQDCVRDSKQRRSNRTSGAAGAHGAFWKNKQITDSSSIENWLRARKKIGKKSWKEIIDNQVPILSNK